MVLFKSWYYLIHKRIQLLLYSFVNLSLGAMRTGLISAIPQASAGNQAYYEYGEKGVNNTHIIIVCIWKQKSLHNKLGFVFNFIKYKKVV